MYLIRPFHTESVVGIVGRSELLSACLFMAAWLLFRDRRTGATAVLFFLSLLSKESAITFPAIMALDMMLFKRRHQKRSPQLEAICCAWRSGGRIPRLAVPGARFARSAIGQSVLQREYADRSAVDDIWSSIHSILKPFLAPINVIGVYEYNSIPLAGIHDWDAWVGLLLVAGTIVFRVSSHGLDR